MRVKEDSVRKSNKIPDGALEALARCLYPTIRSYFESEEGQREFAEWKRGSTEKSAEESEVESEDIA